MKKNVFINGKRFSLDESYVIDKRNLEILDAPKVKKIAGEIAMARLNDSCDAVANIAVMCFKDLMADLLEEYPLIKSDAVKVQTFRETFLKLMEDYDTGVFNKDHIRSYLKKDKIRRVWKP